MSCSEKFHILEIRDLSVSFRQYDKGTRQVDLPVISRLNVAVHEGEIVAVVGSSGSGKSLLAHAVMGLLPSNARCGGDIYFLQEPLTPKRLAHIRGKEIALVPPERHLPGPFDEGGKAGAWRKEGSGSREAAAGAFSQYGLPEDTAEKYPFACSGGMSRRILLATGPDGKSKADHSGRADPGHGTGAGKKSDGGFPAVCGCGKRRAADYP